jgi:signal transduction histidine kinase
MKSLRTTRANTARGGDALRVHPSRGGRAPARRHDFLTKPVDRQELLLRVKTFVKLRQQDVQLRHQVRELSERDQLIRHQLGELQALDSLRDDLVSLIVHDLRNPLSGIVGFLDVFEQSLADGELREEALMALDASERLREILDDLLRLRLLESGVECLHREPVAADGLVRDAIRSVSGSAKALQVEIAQVIEPPQVDLAVDRKLLRRAIENLLTNALKYSPIGALVEAAVRRKNGDIEIEIADRGAGIPTSSRAGCSRNSDRWRLYADNNVGGSASGCILSGWSRAPTAGEPWCVTARAVAPHSRCFCPRGDARVALMFSASVRHREAPFAALPRSEQRRKRNAEHLL